MGLPEAPGGLLERRYMVVNSLWGSAPSVLLVDTTDKSITRVGDADNAHAALCVADGIAVVHTTAPEVAAGALLTVDVRNGDILASTAAPPLGVISKTLATLTPRRHLQAHVIRVDAFEALLLREEGAEGSDRRWLLVARGPHRARLIKLTRGAGVPGFARFCDSIANYRQEYAFGKALLDSLPGNIGTPGRRRLPESYRGGCATHNVDRDKVAVVGGSHGGFLGAQALSRTSPPNPFKAAAFTKPRHEPRRHGRFEDIPDWVACECASPGTCRGRKY